MKDWHFEFFCVFNTLVRRLVGLAALGAGFRHTIGETEKQAADNAETSVVPSAEKGEVG
jgi:hypothetical protein